MGFIWGGIINAIDSTVVIVERPDSRRDEPDKAIFSIWQHPRKGQIIIVKTGLNSLVYYPLLPHCLEETACITSLFPVICGLKIDVYEG